MSDFQIMIVPATETKETGGEHSDRFEVTQHGRRDEIVQRIEELEGIWDQVVGRLAALAAKSQVVAQASQYELREIEFNLGVEAGLSVGLVTKGNASVSITFARKSDAPGASPLYSAEA